MIDKKLNSIFPADITEKLQHIALDHAHGIIKDVEEIITEHPDIALATAYYVCVRIISSYMVVLGNITNMPFDKRLEFLINEITTATKESEQKLKDSMQ